MDRLAWEEHVRGRRNIQVILRDDDNTVLDSRIIKTDVISGEATHKTTPKRMLKARLIGEPPSSGQ